MRLLNTTTLQFQEFFDSNLPIYATLSHRWDPVEVSYQDYQQSQTKAGPGFEKIRSCCSFAAKQGRAWVWIDTCCIDKASSAEISEAINSMYRWYENAVECYTYLNDVQAHGSTTQLRNSLWFTRGWTLQELLASYRVVFLDCAWEIIGDRQSLAGLISNITGIPELYLNRPGQLCNASVAMKMSWASRRMTSRLEDRAYSLLGLFGVNMPLLYGEGRNAFRRLQLEILKISDDESIFAWRETEHRTEFHGMLAARPEYFANSCTIARRPFTDERPPYSMTHKGLKLHVPTHVVQGTTRIVFPLDCACDEESFSLAIILCKVKGGSWARLQCEELMTVPSEDLWTRRDSSYPNRATIYVAQPDG
jgi:hypothetical protein